MRAAFVGPPQSGKSTLFAAVAEAGGSHVDIHRPDQPHLAVVKVPDERLDWLVELYRPKKVVRAELEFLDIPGLDLHDEGGRHYARTHWASMRQSDMLVLVVRGFEDSSVPAYRGRVDPSGDVQEMLDEMLFADLEQATNRVEKLEAAIRKPNRDREHQLHELELMKRLQETLEAEKPAAEAVGSQAEEKLLRSFAFLSLKPALVVLNCAEDAVGSPAPAMPGSLQCIRLSARIEEEIAELPPEERADFLADMGLKASARDVLVRECCRKMKQVTFLTHSEVECRSWIVPDGTDAVTAAGQIHSDIARGFIRAETVAFDDLRAAGDMKAAKAAGRVRLEGKSYIIRDGDMITFRFNV